MNNSQDTILISGRLDGKQRNHLKRLFDMLYTPKELAEEIGLNIDQIYRVYIPNGCPHERNGRNHILINGSLFCDWYIRTYKKQKLNKDQAFCLNCRKGVKITNPINKNKNGLLYIECTCPECGRKLSKIIDFTRGKVD